MNSPTPTFRQFQLSSNMLKTLRRVGYETPTPIQAAAIEPALAGRDLMGAAQTGTGKTAAFLVPTIERLRKSGGTSLVLAPTRELADQIRLWAERLSGGLHVSLIVGGVAYGPQISALRRKPAIIVATPGRLVDHLERGNVDLGRVRILVLDEADRMLDMGFKPQLDRILRDLPKRRQTLLFSATLPATLGALASVHLHDPVHVDVGRRDVTPRRAKQDVYLVGREAKSSLLLSLADAHAGNMLVFARTKHRTDRLARVVGRAGHAVQRIHSGRSQNQRNEALEGFRRGRYRILIATDIAARGIDVTGIERVVNFDLPQTAEDYVHRIGRTARAEREGHASSFAAPEERAQLAAIEKHLGRSLPRQRHGEPAASATVTCAPARHNTRNAAGPTQAREPRFARVTRKRTRRRFGGRNGSRIAKRSSDGKESAHR